MKNTLTLSDFRTAWANSDRDSSFSYEGLAVLFDYFEEMDPDFELDIVAIDCEFVESSIMSLATEYSILDDISDDIETELVINDDDEIESNVITDMDDIKEMVLTQLRDNTTVLDIDDDNVIIVSY